MSDAIISGADAWVKFLVMTLSSPRSMTPGSVAGTAAFFVGLVEPVGGTHRARAWPMVTATALDALAYLLAYLIVTTSAWGAALFIGTCGFSAGFGSAWGDSYSMVITMPYYIDLPRSPRIQCGCSDSNPSAQRTYWIQTGSRSAISLY